MTDDEQPTEEFAWVRQVYAATPAAVPETIDRAVATAMAAVRSTADAHASAAMANMRRPRGRTPWVRWSPWVALTTALGLVIVLGEQRRRADVAGSTPVAESSRTRVFSSTVPPTLPGGRTHAPMQERGPSTPLDTTPSTTALAPSPTVTMPPRPSERNTVSPQLMAPPQIPAVASSHPTLSERAADGLDSVSAPLVVRLLDSAQARGLPIEGVVARIHEGVRRGVPPQRIVVVARNYIASLDGARTALGASATLAELQAGAEAMLAGAPPGALRQLRAARPAGSLVESLVALADLATHGVAPLRASTALAALIARDGSDTQVRALRAAVIDNIIHGVPPNTALANRTHQPDGHDLRPLVGGGADSMLRYRGSP